MSEAYLTNWSFGGETPATRHHVHQTALREARIASEERAVVAASAAGESILARLRHAFAGRPATDACACPA